jgi:hypothetical protein
LQNIGITGIQESSQKISDFGFYKKISSQKTRMVFKRKLDAGKMTAQQIKNK